MFGRFPANWKLHTATFLALLCALSATEAAAETKLVEPAPEQLKLYESASASFAAGRYEESIAELEKALSLGEVNIFYANMGRALFRLGRCDEADEAYKNALQAPAVPEPKPEAVHEKVLDYQAELLKMCPGEVMLTCNPPDLAVTIDGERPVECGAGPIALSPGSHVFATTYQGVSTDREIQVIAMQRIGLVIDVVDTPAPDDDVVWQSAGLTVGAIGLVVLTGSLVFDLTVVASAEDDFDDKPRDLGRRDRAKELGGLVVGGYLAGALLTATGATLAWLIPALDDDERASLTPDIRPDRVGVSLRLPLGF